MIQSIELMGSTSSIPLHTQDATSSPPTTPDPLRTRHTEMSEHYGGNEEKVEGVMEVVLHPAPPERIRSGISQVTFQESERLSTEVTPLKHANRMPSKKLRPDVSQSTVDLSHRRFISSLVSSRTIETDISKLKKDAKDDRKGRTWIRYFATECMQKVPFYYPNHTADEYSDPNLLEIGWAFYDHFTLARHIKTEDNKDEIVRKLPGDPNIHRDDTVLYNVWKTPGRALDGFGIGVGLYFNSIKVMGLALLAAYLISIPNVLFYQSSEYGEGQDQSGLSGLNLPLRGSAVCTVEKSWVACESKEWCDVGELGKRNLDYATSDNDPDQIFVKKSNCDGATIATGLFNLGALLVVALITLFFMWYQNKKQIISDENLITASDYSVWVNNPPTDAYDAEVWREFFEQYDEEKKGIASVTVLVDNKLLLKPLCIQRLLLKELQKWLPQYKIDPEKLSFEADNKSEQDEAEKAKESLKKECEKREEELNAEPFSIPRLIWRTARPFAKPFKRLLSPVEVFEKLEEFSKIIYDMKHNKEYEVTDVIVTFHTEKAQRKALEALKKGWFDIKFNRTSNSPKEDLFQGKVLQVEEPAEPSAIRYLEVDTTPLQTAIRSSITLAITIGLIALSALIVDVTRKGSSSLVAGLVTSLLNMLIPIIIKLLMLIEKHQSEDARQKSLYLKVTVFRWVNTAITVKFVTPFTNTLGDTKEAIIPAISGILLSEMALVPLIGVLDILGNISKHWFAPRAKTLEQMLLCFKGTLYHIADRYTDVTKVVFLSYYYCSLNPNFLLMGAIAMLARYYADKFCLLRVWYAAPNVGGSIAKFSRQYYFSFAIVAGISVSAYDWALFNFDRVCEGQGSFNATDESIQVTAYGPTPDPTSITVTSTETHRVCTSEGSCCQQVDFKWPPVPSLFQSEEFSWMSNDQETLSHIYGWTSCGVVVIFFFVIFGITAIKWISNLFVGTYKPEGKDQEIDFASKRGIDGYIPQIFIGFGNVYPIICTDITNIEIDLIGWNDPLTEYSVEGFKKHNLIYDEPMFGMRPTPKGRVFDSVKCWGLGTTDQDKLGGVVS